MEPPAGAGGRASIPSGAGTRQTPRFPRPSQGLCCHLSALRGSTARPRPRCDGPRLPQPGGGVPGPGRAAAGRTVLPLPREPRTRRAQPLLPPRHILPLCYKRIVSRNNKFSTLSSLRSDARDRAVIMALGFSHPELSAWPRVVHR